MRRAIGLLGILFLSGAVQALGTQDDGDEAAIRAARARSNRAIAEHDIETVASFWTEDFHIVTSRSVQTSGRDENRDRFGEHFEDLPDVVYVREPTEVSLYEPWAMAFERGTWRGSWSEASGRVSLGGDYAAKWRKVDGRWLIQSEVFSPTFCTGSDYCEAEP